MVPPDRSASGRARARTDGQRKDPPHAQAGKDADTLQLTQVLDLVADGRVRTVAGIDLRRGRELDHALETALHLLAITARQVPAAGAPPEDHVAREEDALAREIKAGRPLGVTGGMQRVELEVRQVAERPLVEEVVRVGRRDLELHRRTRRAA